MHDRQTSLQKLSKGRTPAVVLGDLSLIRPLGEAGIPVVLAALGPDDVAIPSRYVDHVLEVPGFDAANVARSTEMLLDLGARLARVLGRRVPLFYNSDNHLEMLYRNRSAFAANFRMLLNDEETALSLHQKDRFYRLCERRGVLCPRTLQSGSDMDARMKDLREPILVKPKRKTSWRTIQGDLLGGAGKARVFPTREALRAHPAFELHKDDIIVQEYLDGDVASLWSFHGFADEHGRLLASFGGRKLRTYPAFAGESSFIELVRSPALDRVGREIAKKLDLKGVFKIDFLWDAQSAELYTLEINARSNLWHQLGAAHGVNLPAIAYEYLLNGSVPPAEPFYEPTYRWLDLYRDWGSFREANTRGTLSLGDWLTSIADPRVICETFAWRDPLPFARWLTRFVGERLARRS